MNIWLIEPRDPLIVRDGKPIGGDASIETLPFPFPSTVAGAARTRMASPNGEFLFPGNQKALDELLAVPIAGPILAEVDGATGTPIQYCFPAPRDAVVVPAERDEAGFVQTVALQRLRPADDVAGVEMDSLGMRALRPIRVVGLENTGKPFEKAPAYWNQQQFLGWLTNWQIEAPYVAPDELGVEGLPTETRVHVVIRPGERVGVDGGLFQTKGLRFAQERRVRDRAKLGQTRHFALAIRTQPGKVAGHQVALRDELAPIGGERRLARWHSCAMGWPALPVAIRESVRRTKRARIVLLTPAMFTEGALPGWNGKPWAPWSGLKVTVEGACVGRPVVVSGWDLTKGARGEKPTRRLAPAGSVYFVRIGDEETSDGEIDAWLERTWLGCVSDAERDRLDGFGLAMIGVWEEGA